MTPSPSALRVVAGYGMPGAMPSPAIGPLHDDELATLLEHCERHRLLGLLGAAVRGNALLVTADQHQRIEQLLQAWLAHALRIERLLLDTGRALDREGIAHRVLKGVAVAHAAYPDPGWRVFGDLDLLVPGDQLSAAARVLERELGATRVEPELRPGFDDRFGKEAMLQTAQGLEVDLHRTFVAGALGLSIELGDLFVAAEHFTLGERTFDVLPPAQQLLHAAYGAVVADWPPRLASMRDLVQIALVHDPSKAEVCELAVRWRARLVLALGLTGAWTTLKPPRRPALMDWAEAYRPTRTERAVLASHRGSRRATTRHLMTVVVLPRMRDRAAYLRAVMWPQRTYLRARGFGRAGHAGRAVARLRRSGSA